MLMLLSTSGTRPTCTSMDTHIHTNTNTYILN